MLDLTYLLKHNVHIGGVNMNRLSQSDRAKIIGMLVEGNSVASTCRMSGASKNTVLKLLADVGDACAAYQDRAMRDLKLRRVQADEIWSFVGMKQKNVCNENVGVFGYGDVYTWTAIDADTKLIPCWHVGTRGAESAYTFIHDLAGRLSSRIQLTTDGHKIYVEAVEDAFGTDIDYAMLVKHYSNPSDYRAAEKRYSPSKFVSADKRRIVGNPDIDEVSTSYVERSNLTMRMNVRRFTRLTNAFSKKLENHMHAISLYFMHYNFCRVHKTLRVTPAMEAGLTDHIWEIEEVIMMSDTNV